MLNLFKYYSDVDKLYGYNKPYFLMDSGDKVWYLNGKMHRLDGPAVEYGSGSVEWIVHGKRHRTDGPSFVGANGEYKEWHLDGKHYSEKDWKEKTKN